MGLRSTGGGGGTGGGGAWAVLAVLPILLIPCEWRLLLAASWLALRAAGAAAVVDGDEGCPARREVVVVART